MLIKYGNVRSSVCKLKTFKAQSMKLLICIKILIKFREKNQTTFKPIEFGKQSSNLSSQNKHYIAVQIWKKKIH